MLWIALASLLFSVAVGVLHWLWIHWLRKRTATPRWLLIVAGMGVGVPLASGMCGTSFYILNAYAAVSGEYVDPTQKPRILEIAIESSMNCNVLGLLVVFAVMVPLLLALTWKYHWSRAKKDASGG